MNKLKSNECKVDIYDIGDNLMLINITKKNFEVNCFATLSEIKMSIDSIVL